MLRLINDATDDTRTVSSESRLWRSVVPLASYVLFIDDACGSAAASAAPSREEIC